MSAGPVGIAALEAARYEAMRAGDAAALHPLLSARLHYSHSQGEHDGRESYLAKVEAGFFTYHEVSYAIEWIEELPGVALVGGRMAARVSVSGEERRIDNAFLAVWADEGDAWRLLAYQPTPLRR